MTGTTRKRIWNLALTKGQWATLATAILITLPALGMLLFGFEGWRVGALIDIPILMWAMVIWQGWSLLPDAKDRDAG